METQQKLASNRAVQLLNHRKPEHPPDIYFIRRNPKLLDKYLDPVEMDGLVKEAAPRLKVNYNLFGLDPQEKEIMQTIQSRKRNFLNPDDPFFTRCRGAFRPQVDSVFHTDKVLSVISPKDHTRWKKATHEKIKSESKEIMDSICDRDHFYYRAASRGQEVNQNSTSSPAKDENTGYAALALKKAHSNHYKVRQNKDEYDKLYRIENELQDSIELCRVSHPQDTEDFENTTNKEFNRNYEKEIASSHDYATLKPILQNRPSRRAPRAAELSQQRHFLEPLLLSNQFQVDELAIKTFTFKQRYNKNVSNGRNTSTLSQGTRQGFFFPKMPNSGRKQGQGKHNRSKFSSVVPATQEEESVRKLSFSFPSKDQANDVHNIPKPSFGQIDPVEHTNSLSREVDEKDGTCSIIHEIDRHERHSQASQEINVQNGVHVEFDQVNVFKDPPDVVIGSLPKI